VCDCAGARRARPCLIGPGIAIYASSMKNSDFDGACSPRQEIEKQKMVCTAEPAR
jgi:hypothetical protein